MDKDIYLDENESNGNFKNLDDVSYDDGQEKMCCSYNEIKNYAGECWITYEEIYLDNDDEPDADQNTREKLSDENNIDCDVNDNEKDTTAKVYYNVEHEIYTNQNKGGSYVAVKELCDEKNGDCDDDANENDTTVDAYYTVEHEIYTSQGEGEAPVAVNNLSDERNGDCDGDANENDTTADVYYTVEHEIYTIQGEGEAPVAVNNLSDERNGDCDGDANENDTTADAYYIVEHEIYTSQGEGEAPVAVTELCDERNGDCDGDSNENDTTADEYYTMEDEMYTNQDKGVYVKDKRQDKMNKIDESMNENNSTLYKEQSLHLKLFVIFKRLMKKLILDFDLQKEAMEKAIDHLNFNFRNVVKGKIPTEVNFNDMNNCAAYVRRFATCHASVVYAVTLQVLKNLPIEFSRISTLNRKLSLVSVGSGPGNDLVGFLEAFHDHHHLKFDHLDLTTIDKMSGWHHVFKQTVEILKEENCNACRMFREVPYITTSFFQADLEQSEFWCNGMLTKLKNADVVLLVKVLSNIPDANKFRLLEDIVVRIKRGALLIIIDNPMPCEELSALTSLKTIYKIRKKLFRLDRKVKRADRYNISACMASAHIFKKQN